MENNAPHTILIAEDDDDDRLLIEDAFVESGFTLERKYFGDGVELLAHLATEVHPDDALSAKLPSLILLDLTCRAWTAQRRWRI